MPVSTVHYLYGLALPTGDVINQLTDGTPAANHQLLTGMSAGYPQPLFQAIQYAKPDVQFTTPQLATLLNALGLFGLAGSDSNTDLIYVQGQNLGSRFALADTDHKRIRMAKGLCYWTQIRAPMAQPAVASVRVKPIFDGTHAPFVPAGSIAITQMPSAVEHFRLAGLYVQGPDDEEPVEVPGLTQATLDLGIRMDELGADDDLYDTYCGLAELNPTLTLEGLTWENWLDMGLTGEAVSWALYLRKKAADSNDVAIGTAEHIALSGDFALGITDRTSGGENRPANTGFRLALRADATDATDEGDITDVITIDTASTVPS